MKRYILLLNQASGASQRGLDGEETCLLAKEIFRQHGHAIETACVPPHRIEQAIRQAKAREPHAILIGGGDGTVSTAARLLGDSPVALGVLPLGTFNLAARDLGVPLEIEPALHFLAQAEALSVDVLDVAGHACLCTTILGFYPEFADIFERRESHGGRWWKKALRLFAGLPRTFSKSRPIELFWEGENIHGRSRTKFSAFVPGRYKESAGIVPARTAFRSGKFTAYIGTHQSATSALKGIFDYVVGRSAKDAELFTFEADELDLYLPRRKHAMVMLDGEILRLRLPIRMKLLNRHLSVLTTLEQIEGSPRESA